MTDLQIEIFPCLSDNYGILIHDPKSGQTATIDTPDATEIARQCKTRGWTLTEIWNTHWHPDHTGGNHALTNGFDVTTYGPDLIEGRIPHLDIGVGEGDRFHFGDHEVIVFHTPGHTDEHIIYYVKDANGGRGAAFVGDTIFVMGCGKLFEGSPAQMHDSLSKIMALPDDTKLYCAHEYTLSNARFAAHIDPNNQALMDAIEVAKATREKGLPTVPTTVAAERITNPFITAGNAKELGRRRALKDKF